jgi:hypothetical protein
MSRYHVTMTPDRRSWAILDRTLFGYCTLPDDGDPASLLPLEWKNRAAAEAWLNRCRMAWQAGTVPAPEGWRPLPPELSPWA